MLFYIQNKEEEVYGECYEVMIGSQIPLIKHCAVLISVLDGNMVFSHVLQCLFQELVA